MWGAAAEGLSDFFAQADEALQLVENALNTGLSVDRPYPLLTTMEEDLDAVRGAFDISVLDPDDLVPSATVSPEMIAAAAILQRAVLDIIGGAESSRFILRVGLDGTIGGSLRGRVVQGRGKVSFRFGYHGEPTNLPPVKAVFEALDGYADDLLTVCYESGHTAVDGRIWKRELRASPFPNWEFDDFSGFDITREKPAASSIQTIHDAIGNNQDTSLFGWVLNHYSSGWLVCDDGPGEVADFVHVAQDSAATLSLIHVKAAASAQSQRHVAVGPYEVVVSQAAKNIRYLSIDDLAVRLSNCSITRPACWTDGHRVEDRTEFLEALACRTAHDLNRVVIVQPHVSAGLYSSARTEGEPSGVSLHNALRMKLLEALLNTTRASVVGLGADLYVIGSKK